MRMTISSCFCVALLGLSVTCLRGQDSDRRNPQPQVKYALGPESLPQPNVPKGKLEGPFLHHSKIIENTVRKYWVYIPAQYDPNQPASVLVFQDGARAINPNGVLRVDQVLENLIAKKQIPVTIGIFITPGQRGEEFPDDIGTGNPNNRDREYDVLNDAYARLLIEEILPEVGKTYNLTKDPAGRAIGGSSSGGICAFTVAWERPDQFRNVISTIGSFTNIHGGHVYPILVRDAPAKPIRIFLQDGVNDNRNPNDLERDWHLQNQNMVTALQDKGYDMAHAFGQGGHSDDHGGAMLPQMLRWIWRDFPGVEPVTADLVAEAAEIKPEFIELFPGFDANAHIDPSGTYQWQRRFGASRPGTNGGTQSTVVLQMKDGKLSGTYSSQRGDQAAISTELIRPVMEGNKLIFDVVELLREREFQSTYQGIVTEQGIKGWRCAETGFQGGDSPWNATRVNVETSPNKVNVLAAPTSEQDKAKEAALGMFDNETDIGEVGKRGKVVFDAAASTYAVSGGGANMWFAEDELHFVSSRADGDVSIAANIDWPSPDGDAHRKACLILRQSLSPDSAYVDVAVHGDGLCSIQYRETAGDNTHEIQANVSAPERVRLEKQGDYVSMFIGENDDNMSPSGGVFRIHFDEPFYVGIGVCAHNDERIETAVFSNIQVRRDLPKLSAKVVESTLETVSIASTDRRVIYHTKELIEAPNWHPDGQTIVFNSSGHLFSIPVKGNELPREIDTGTLNRLNNDHGVSADGKTLVISDQTLPGGSRIYTLPISGGTPQLVTKAAPSYWHGWSPDGKTLAYCASRNDEFDIYSIPVDGGVETRLTTATGLDDGPDYSADGKSIYFNSDRTGKMQIWRMNVDGTEQTQITTDDFNNWFPHPSPDGRYLVFVSFAPNVVGHPANQDVALRMLSLENGTIKTLAKLFGGQGTINVPSWSPDSRSVAFVSYQRVSQEGSTYKNLGNPFAK